MVQFIVRFFTVLTLSFLGFAAQADDGLFIKLSGTSLHFGAIEDIDFNEANVGLGLGYSWENVEVGPLGDIDVAVSGLVYRDSFFCDSFNLQLRGLKPVSERLSLGVSGNIAYKCMSPNSEPYLFAAPLLSATYELAEGITLAVDAAPAIDDVNPIGFIGFSLELSF